MPLWLPFLTEAPGGGGDSGFHLVLDGVGEVTEEVDACELLQLVDGADVGGEVLLVLVVVAVLQVEADGLVAAVGGTAVLAEDGHEEVLGDAQGEVGIILTDNFEEV